MNLRSNTPTFEGHVSPALVRVMHRFGETHKTCQVSPQEMALLLEMPLDKA